MEFHNLVICCVCSSKEWSFFESETGAGFSLRCVNCGHRVLVRTSVINPLTSELYQRDKPQERVNPIDIPEGLTPAQVSLRKIVKA